MEMYIILEKLRLITSYEICLTFKLTFEDCLISQDNLINFCKAFNLDINSLK